jgi:hypothetical protein
MMWSKTAITETIASQALRLSDLSHIDNSYCRLSYSAAPTISNAGSGRYKRYGFRLVSADGLIVSRHFTLMHAPLVKHSVVSPLRRQKYRDIHIIILNDVDHTACLTVAASSAIR